MLFLPPGRPHFPYTTLFRSHRKHREPNRGIEEPDAKDDEADRPSASLESPQLYCGDGTAHYSHNEVEYHQARKQREVSEAPAAHQYDEPGERKECDAGEPHRC